MKLALLLLLTIAPAAFAGDWESVGRIPTDRKIEVTTQDGKRARGAFVSANADAIVLRDGSGERSLLRTEVRRVRVHDPLRRLRQGLIWTGVGAAAGAGIGAAVCPSCANEGHGYKFVGPGIGVGAGIGALGFLSSPYRTIYQSK